MNLKERRRAPRAVSNVPLDLYDREGRMVIGEGHFVNLSTKGCLLESRQTLPQRKRIRLQIRPVAKFSPLELSGRIIWARRKSPPFTYGIAFDALAA